MTDIVFETERLRVTLWRDEHAEAAFPAYSDSNFTRGLGASRMHDTIDDTRAWIGRIRKMYDDRGPERGFWAVERQDTGEAVGATMCQPLPDGDGEHEIGWHVFPAHQHNGYATESGAGAAAYGFHVLGLDEVFAVVANTNEPSLAVARRLGMQHLGRTSKYYDMVEAELFRLSPA